MTGPNSHICRVRRNLEDMKALLAEIENRRRVIFLQAFHEGDWDAVFDEARFMGGSVEALKAELDCTWEQLTALMRKET